MWLLSSNGNAVNPGSEFLFPTLGEMEKYLVSQSDNLTARYTFRFVPKWEPLEPGRRGENSDKPKVRIPEPLSR